MISKTLVFLAGAAVWAQSTPAKKEFEVVSIKPMKPTPGRQMVQIQMAPGGRFVARGVTLKMLIQEAYGVRDFQIQGVPAWASTDPFEVNAKGSDEKIPQEDLRLMLRSMLEDRFQLAIRHETKEAPVYALHVAKNGSKLKEAPAAAPGQRKNMMRMGRGTLDAQGVGMDALCNMLSNQLGRRVLDETGLKGAYDVKLEWTPEHGEGAVVRQSGPDAPAPPADASGPSIYSALEEQLGLKLDSTRGQVELLIVERAERPSEN